MLVALLACSEEIYLIVWKCLPLWGRGGGGGTRLAGSTGASRARSDPFCVQLRRWFQFESRTQTDYISHPALGHLQQEVQRGQVTAKVTPQSALVARGDDGTWLRPNSAAAPPGSGGAIEVAALADPGTAEPPGRERASDVSMLARPPDQRKRLYKATFSNCVRFTNCGLAALLTLAAKEPNVPPRNVKIDFILQMAANKSCDPTRTLAHIYDVHKCWRLAEVTLRRASVSALFTVAPNGPEWPLKTAVKAFMLKYLPR